MRILVLFFLLLASASTVLGFVVTRQQQPFSVRDVVSSDNNNKSYSSSSSTQLFLTDPTDAAVQGARTTAFIWLFGASGGAGIARSAFPRMYNSVRATQKLKGVGPTSGGEKLGMNPLCGLPEDLCVADVEKIVNNKLSVAEMVQKYPVEGNFLAESGYLTFSAFQEANQGANPLAVRAVFDSLNTSTDVCDPRVAQQKLDSYKADVNNFKTELLKSKLSGYSAIVVLLFLLALADWQAFAIHGREGWFPDWPGLENPPASLFDSETGLLAIPKYWI